MDELLSEKEQIEQMRGWWRENGTYVIAGLVLGVGGIFGFNAWKSSEMQIQIDASTRFEALAEEVAENRLESAEAVAADLYTEFGTTVYSDQARLAMARLYMDQGRDQDAAEVLDALVTSGVNEQMKMVARLRLAKVYLYQGKADEVLALLDGFDESGFAARYSEAVGDAYYALGDFAAAEAAWLEALTLDGSNQLINTALIQMKIGDLPSGETGAELQPAAESPDGADDVATDEMMDATPGEEPGE